MLDRNYYLKEFVNQIAKMNKGRVFYTTPDQPRPVHPRRLRLAEAQALRRPRARLSPACPPPERHPSTVLPANRPAAPPLLLVILPVIGTAGYMIIEGWSFLDALYMTVTVADDHRVPGSPAAGRLRAQSSRSLLAIAGVGTIFYGLVSLFQFVIEGELGNYWGYNA